MRGLRVQLAIFVVFAALAALSTGKAWAKYASIVIDAETGEVLHEANADDRNYPASLTKMMTLYLAFEALEQGRLELTTRLPVSKHAASRPPSKLGLAPGETISVRDVILALITKSANDAAVVMAEGIAGSESAFAQRMTAKARELGMTNTTFRNASGLPHREQVTTARDLAKLSQALLKRFPKYYRYFSTEDFAYKGVVYHNHNRLMSRFEGMDGIKTGFIRASGFNLAASAMRDNRRLIGIVMGGQSARSRDIHMAELLENAFAGRSSLPPVMVAKNETGSAAVSWRGSIRSRARTPQQGATSGPPTGAFRSAPTATCPRHAKRRRERPPSFRTKTRPCGSWRRSRATSARSIAHASSASPNRRRATPAAS